jgi:hypothetical protein
LFITQEISGHEGLWWNDIDKEKLLILSPGISGSHISSKTREIGELNYQFSLAKYLFHTSKGVLT